VYTGTRHSWGVSCCITSLNLHQTDNFSTCKVWHFQCWADFRAKNCLSYTKPKLVSQKEFSVVGLVPFFQFKSETAFRLKSILGSSQVKHCQIETGKWSLRSTELLTFGHCQSNTFWTFLIYVPTCSSDGFTNPASKNLECFFSWNGCCYLHKNYKKSPNLFEICNVRIYNYYLLNAEYLPTSIKMGL
jgi:hypothetical protein